MSKPQQSTRKTGQQAGRPRLAIDWPIPALAALVLLVYGNSLLNGFVTDDRLQVVRNPWIKSIRFLPDMLTTASWGWMGGTSNYYRPTQMLAYSAIYALRGTDAFSFHLMMVLLHLATTLLVYLLVRRLSSANTALAAGALFAVHPIHTEVVDWIAAFPDAFMTLVVVLAVWVFVRQNGSPRGIQIVGHCALYLLALFSKEPGAMLLPLYLGFEWICLRRTVRDLFRNFALYAGMFAVVIFYLFARYHALRGFAPLARVLSTGEFAMSVVTMTAQYFAKLVAPTDLSYFHVFEPTRSPGVGFLISLLAVLSLATACLLLRQRSALSSFGLWWIAVTLAPALNLPALSDNAFTERYLYLPSVGFVWIAALAWEWLSKRNPALGYSAGAIVLTIFAWTTFARNEDWHDDLRLMLVTARQAPTAAVVRDNLANDYVEAGQLDQALAQEKAASELDPLVWRYRLNFGNLLIRRDPRAAVQQCESVLRDAPGEPDANYCIGAAWQAAGDSKQAVAEYERTLAIAPNYYAAMVALHRLYWEAGRVPEAIDLLQRAAKLRPTEPEPLIRLAVLYSDGGKYQEAAQAAQQGLALSPDPDLGYFAHFVLGTIYERNGSLQQSANEFAQAAQLHPDRPAARQEYEKVLAQLNAK